MKFSDIERERWPELAPYLDTVLLPLSGLTGAEEPWEATEALERLRDALYPLETAFKGRVLTYPAVHYAADGESLERLVDKLCERLSEAGFIYCVVVTGCERVLDLRFERASAVIGPGDRDERDYARRAKAAIETLWSSGSRIDQA